MRDFRKYTVWQESYALVLEVYKIVDKLPSNERFNLASQMSRAAVSMPSNISEGCSRSSDVEFKRFLEIAVGSSFELETQLMLCRDLNLSSENEIMIVIQKLTKIQASLNALIQKIKSE